MMMLMMVGVVTVVGVAASVVVKQSREQVRIEVLKRIAAQSGLRFEPGRDSGRPSLVGLIDGVDVTVGYQYRKTGKSDDLCLRAVAVSPVPLPTGLVVSRQGMMAQLAKAMGMQDILVGDEKLDDAARIRGEDPTHVQQVFEGGRLRLALTLLVADSFDGVDEGRIVMETRSIDSSSGNWLVTRVVEAAKAFEDAVVQPWRDLAVAQGLELRIEGDEVAAFAKALDGTVAEVAGVLSTGRTVFRIRPPITLPAGMRVVAGEADGALRLGDPILDGRLSATGAPLTEVRALLCDEAVRGELMAVLHGFPESRIEDGMVVLVATAGSYQTLNDRMMDALRLADALAVGGRPVH